MPVVVTFDKELQRLVQVTDFFYFSGRMPVNGAFEEFQHNLNTSDPDQLEYWRKLRLVMRANLTANKIKSMMSVFEAITDKFFKTVKEGQDIDVYEKGRELSFEQLAGALFHIDGN